LAAKFTVDLERWYDALPGESGESRIQEPTEFLLDLLAKYNVKATFYVLGLVFEEHEDLVSEIANLGHTLGSHGYKHDHNLCGSGIFRSPYWDTTPMPQPPSGGFFFRALPLTYIKWAVKKSGVFWLHPHDIDEGHPKLKNPLLNIKRHIGLKGARKKLERLLQEVEFA